MMVITALAVLAGPGNIRYLAIREGATVADLIHPHPEVLGQPVVRVLLPEGYVVLSHTGHHAGATARAFVQVNCHPILVNPAVSFMMCLFHGYPFSND